MAARKHSYHYIKRLEKLVALLAVAFDEMDRIGEFEAKQKPIPLKKLRGQKDHKIASLDWALIL